MKHFFSAATIIVASIGLTSCSNTTNETAKTNDDVILHAWSWSFNTIANNMKDIAESGYDYVQTSPANTCFIGDNGGMALFSQEGDSVMGKWRLLV